MAAVRALPLACAAVSALLALIAAALFGAGDFIGGYASRRSHPLKVLATSTLAGLLLASVVGAATVDRFSAGPMLAGAAAGASGLLGMALLYHGLGRGPMAVVAPVTAVNSAAIPVVWGLATGDHLSPLQVLGVLVGLGSIFLVSRVPGGSGELPSGLLLEAVLAGAGFAGFYIVVDAADDAAAPWPVLGAALSAAVLTVAVALVLRIPPIPARTERTALLAASTGFMNVAANVLFLVALNIGLLSLVAVLTSLYPAATVILARTVLGERMGASQVVGIVGAVGAIALIGLG